MHKLKNKHTGEVITTPYMAEAQEYLDSGDYEMSDKPVYTREMHERGELPPIGSLIRVRYNHDSKTVTHQGFVLYSSDRYVILNQKSMLDQESIDVCHKIGDYIIEPIPTIEDEFVDFVFQNSGIRSRDGGMELAIDLAEALMDKYNITPKG